ncbi:hypothetical protein [Pseudothermotoga sp.]|uniref:hypothetical protein n=1 Tax=Pseudothermotoga sp. TaxID=2033661 RepID=UPI000E9ACF00|nr:hypothetical protein [Pseudothermotoga sp.]HBJ81223.1 hypothetical protein [Pseudothermotoga sp.]
MKKFYLIIFISLTLNVSCGKDEEPIKYVVSYPTDDIIHQYIPIEENDIYHRFTEGIDTSYIYIWGFIDNKLSIKEFDKQSKQNTWNWISKRNINIGEEVIINKGYGETETYKIDEIIASKIFKDKNNYIIVEDEYSERFMLNSFIHFIPNNNEVAMLEYKRSNSEPFYPPNIVKWYNESVLLINPEKYVQCLNYSGKIISDIGNIDGFNSSASNYLAINYEEVIQFDNGCFIRKNIKKDGVTAWVSEKVLKDLPSNIRIDRITYEVIDMNFTKCTFNYTTYEGDKKVIAFKINNNSGELVQL